MRLCSLLSGFAAGALLMVVPIAALASHTVTVVRGS